MVLKSQRCKALKARAELHDRSVETKVCVILADTIRPELRIGMGDALASLGRKIGLKNDGLAVFEQVPVKFE